MGFRVVDDPPLATVLHVQRTAAAALESGGLDDPLSAFHSASPSAVIAPPSGVSIPSLDDIPERRSIALGRPYPSFRRVASNFSSSRLLTAYLLLVTTPATPANRNERGSCHIPKTNQCHLAPALRALHIVTRPFCIFILRSFQIGLTHSPHRKQNPRSALANPIL